MHDPKPGWKNRNMYILKEYCSPLTPKRNSLPFRHSPVFFKRDFFHWHLGVSKNQPMRNQPFDGHCAIGIERKERQNSWTSIFLLPWVYHPGNSSNNKMHLQMVWQLVVAPVPRYKKSSKIQHSAPRNLACQVHGGIKKKNSPNAMMQTKRKVVGHLPWLKLKMTPY